MALCAADQLSVFFPERHSRASNTARLPYRDRSLPSRPQMCLRFAERICPVGVEALLLQAVAGTSVREDLVREVRPRWNGGIYSHNLSVQCERWGKNSSLLHISIYPEKRLQAFEDHRATPIDIPLSYRQLLRHLLSTPRYTQPPIVSVPYASPYAIK